MINCGIGDANDAGADDDFDGLCDGDDIHIIVECLFVCLSRFCLFCLPPAKLTSSALHRHLPSLPCQSESSTSLYF